MDRPMQFIDGDGNFKKEDLDAFSEKVKLPECGSSYAVVSIMGPQSGGKSTLLNHLFRTNFKEMDTLKERCQTTKGIWVAKCVDIKPCTLAIDLEGSDGKERGEDEVFEKRSALFALAISDVVLINMWCKDIGLEKAGNRPLLRTIFEVMLCLFSQRKITLLFVIRDKSKTPPGILEGNLRKSIQQIYNSVAKPHNWQETSLNKIFNVQVIFLSSYEEKEEEFKEQVANLRSRFINSIAPGGVAGDQTDKLPASDFSLNAKWAWDTIMENKDLNLPTHKVMVAKERCEEIAKEQKDHFAQNKDWLRLEAAVKKDDVSDFGKTLTSIIHTYLSRYDNKVDYYDQSVAASMRQVYLLDPMLKLIEPAYDSMLKHLHSRVLREFKEAFTGALHRGKQFVVAARDCKEKSLSNFHKGCKDADISGNWDSSNIHNMLQDGIDAHVASVRASKLSELESCYKQKLTTALSGHVEDLLNEAKDDTWLKIRKHLQKETDLSLSSLSKDTSGFNIDQKTKDVMSAKIKNYARGVVQAKAKENAMRVRILMKDRFSTEFKKKLPTTWTGKEDIPTIRKTVYSAPLRLLSVMAADRLDGDDDNIANTLSDALLDSTGNSANEKCILTSNTWEKVDSSKTFITPVECKSIWNDFIAAVCEEVIIATEAQQASKRDTIAKAELAKVEAERDRAKAELAKAEAERDRAKAEAEAKRDASEFFQDKVKTVAGVAMQVTGALTAAVGTVVGIAGGPVGVVAGAAMVPVGSALASAGAALHYNVKKNGKREHSKEKRIEEEKE